MDEGMPSARRLIVVALIAAALLLALVIAMGGTTLPSPTSGAITTPPTSAPAPTSAPQTQPAGAVKGTVTATAQHLSGHTWRFRYVVHNTGKVPIAGFEINTATSNLFNIKGPAWNVFGSGVCKGNNPGLLVYWSTNSGATDHIAPDGTASFSFEVNTTGPTSAGYSLSYGTAAPQFGQTKVPEGSSLPATGPCK